MRTGCPPGPHLGSHKLALKVPGLRFHTALLWGQRHCRDPLGLNDSGDLRVLGPIPDQGGRRPGVVAEGNRPELSLLLAS